MIGKILRRGFALAMLTGIFLLSNQPSLDVLPPLFPMQDKVLHAGEFFLLGLSLLLNRDVCPRRRCPVLLVFAFGALWGGLDEFHQSFIPGRDCSFGDFAADLVGLCLAMVLPPIRLRVRRETHQKRLTTEGSHG